MVNKLYEIVSYLWNIRSYTAPNGEVFDRIFGDNSYRWVYDNLASTWRCYAGH
jgi:hypothetical protein